MGTYYYDDQVKFELPWDYEYSKEYDDDGKESDHIKTGSYYNDDGEKCYKFSCKIGTVEVSDDTPVTSLRDMLKNMLQSENKTRGLVLDGELEVALVTRGMPMNLFGITLQYYTLLAFVLAENEKVINLAVVQMYEEDDEDKNFAVFENMATIIRSMSVNGKKNDLQGMDAQALHTALKPYFNEEDNIDIGARLREMLGGSEEEMSYADQPLPEGVCASEDGYAVINEDWAVRLPDGWVFSTEEEHTCGRPFAAISRKEYDESGRGPFTYGDNCFTVFRVAEAESNEYGMHSLLAGLMNSNEETVIDRPGLKVSYNCRHEENSTHCQYVTVTTYRASYMIQLFYTDPDLGEYSRVMKIEEILKTICHSYEVPYSERYQRREHAKPAATPVKTAKKNNISFIRAYPDESLYPHYNSLLHSPLKSLGFLGVNVVVNSTGTEYEFQSFHSMLNSFTSDPDANLSDTQRDRLTRILNSDTAAYDLHEKAKAMQGLFHVEPSVFDPKHDRECELEHSLMHRAYMMSALRSFAWTLSAYCKESGETPATVDYSCIRDLIAYIASHNWLNYDGESHCDGLCGGSDLHVYFVPDSTSVEDRRQLRGDGMSGEEEAQIRENFQNFNIIRSQVQSLDALRRDLTYIYPAIEKIYNTLKTSRNNREQLLGDEADILYAWCALALAAKEPFFSEDGPMNYWFDQKETEEEAEANRLQQEKAVYDAWIAKYGAYLAPDPQISFSGKLFVFSGLATHADPKDHPTIQKVLDRGGEFRSKVSGLTDYLVIDPAFGGGSKLNTAIEQQKKGKPVQIILLKDLEAALGETVMPAIKETTHLVILANFWKNGIYSKGFEFPGDFGITFDAEQTIFNWKTCNREDDVEADIDGLGSAVNFTSVFMSGGKKIGGLYDALIECYGPKGDALHDEFYTEIASAIKNDSAISLILASVIPQNGKMCGSWIVMDYSSLSLKAGKEEWAASESEALEKAKARMEELARQCQTAAEEKTRKEMEEKRHREEEEAQFRALQRARQEAEAERKRMEEEAERKRKEEEAERKRKAVEEAERQRQAELVAKRARYDEISNAINLQMQIIAQNKGWFGAQAKARKAAQEHLATLQAQLAKEFPKGKP